MKVFNRPYDKIVFKMQKVRSRLPIPCPDCGKLHLLFVESSFKHDSEKRVSNMSCLECAHKHFLGMLIDNTVDENEHEQKLLEKFEEYMPLETVRKIYNSINKENNEPKNKK